MVIPEEHKELLYAAQSRLASDLQTDDGLLSALMTARLITVIQQERYEQEYRTRYKRAEAIMRDLHKGPHDTLARLLECLAATGQEDLVRYIRNEAKDHNIPRAELQDPELREKLQQGSNYKLRESERIPALQFTSYQTDLILGDKLKENLKTHYRQNLQQIPLKQWDEHQRFGRLDQMYTRLSLISEEPSGGKVRKISLRHQSQILQKLHGEKHPPTRILIRGKAGIGKTTLMNKYTLHWVEQPENSSVLSHLKRKLRGEQLLDFCGVFLISLRSVKEGSTLVSTIKDVLDIHFPEETIKQYLTDNAEHILILLDGYDEYHNQSQELTNLIEGKLLRKATVVMTTRPTCMLPAHAHRDRLVEIEGFKENEQKHYIKEFFKEDPKKGKQLIKQIKIKDLWNFSHHPLLLLMLCVLFDDTSVVQSSMAELYHELIKLMHKRQSDKQQENYQSYDQLLENEHYPLAKLQDILSLVGQLALETLFSGKQEFNIPNNLDPLIRDSAEEMGLIQVFYSVEDKKHNTRSASFLHKTFQEYCATWWVVHASDCKLSQVCSQLDCNIEELRNLVMFAEGMTYAGEVSIPEDAESVSSSEDSSKIVTRFLSYHTRMLENLFNKLDMTVGKLLDLDYIKKIAQKMIEENPKINKGKTKQTPCDIWPSEKDCYQALRLAISNRRIGPWMQNTHEDVVPYWPKESPVEAEPFAPQHVYLCGGPDYRLSVTGAMDLRALLLHPPGHLHTHLHLHRLTALLLAFVTLDTAGWGVILNAPLKVLWLYQVNVQESTHLQISLQHPHPYRYVDLSLCNLSESAVMMLEEALTAALNLVHLNIGYATLQGTEDVWRQGAAPQSLTYVRLHKVDPGKVVPCIIQWAEKSKQLKPNIRKEEWEYCSQGIRRISELPLPDGVWPPLDDTLQP